MICKNLEVRVSDDTTANSIANFIQIASRFESHIDISVGEKRVNAKSLMGMLAVGVTKGDNIDVFVDGSDELEAMKCIEQYLNN